MNEEQLEKTIQFYLKALNETITTATTVSESGNDHYEILGQGIFYNQKDGNYLYAIGAEVYVKKTKEEILEDLQKRYSAIATNLKKLQGEENV
ncbi:Prefoldin subunit alpha [uncultured archaeon]|nr:Prefoldin subunit alpha [uncultured archaeon]